MERFRKYHFLPTPQELENPELLTLAKKVEVG